MTAGDEAENPPAFPAGRTTQSLQLAARGRPLMEGMVLLVGDGCC
jgi:hypothetical protein